MEYRKLLATIGPIYSVIILFIRITKRIPKLNQLLGDIDTRSRICCLCDRFMSSSKRGIEIHFKDHHNMRPDVSLTQSLVVRNWFVDEQEEKLNEFILKAKEINIPALTDVDIEEAIDQMYFHSVSESIREEVYENIIEDNSIDRDPSSNLVDPNLIQQASNATQRVNDANLISNLFGRRIDESFEDQDNMEFEQTVITDSAVIQNETEINIPQDRKKLSLVWYNK